jgi:hypothetical protein
MLLTFKKLDPSEIVLHYINTHQKAPYFCNKVHEFIKLVNLVDICNGLFCIYKSRLMAYKISDYSCWMKLI